MILSGQRIRKIRAGRLPGILPTGVETMRVKIFDVDQDTGAETYREHCELIECFPDGRGDPEYWDAVTELVQGPGRYWVGGGAAPLVLLMLA
jgi:hypothetical protein